MRAQRSRQVVDGVVARVPLRVLWMVGGARVTGGVDPGPGRRQPVEPGRSAPHQRGLARPRLRDHLRLAADGLELQRGQRPDATRIAPLPVRVYPGGLDPRVLHHHVGRFLADGGAAIGGSRRGVDAKHFNVGAQSERELAARVGSNGVERVLGPEARLRVPDRDQLALAALGHLIHPGRHRSPFSVGLAPAIGSRLRGRGLRRTGARGTERQGGGHPRDLVHGAVLTPIAGAWLPRRSARRTPCPRSPAPRRAPWRSAPSSCRCCS